MRRSALFSIFAVGLLGLCGRVRSHRTLLMNEPERPSGRELVSIHPALNGIRLGDDEETSEPLSIPFEEKAEDETLIPAEAETVLTEHVSQLVGENRLVEAEAYLRHVLDSDENNASVLNILGCLYTDHPELVPNGRKAAIEVFERALKNCTDPYVEASVYYNLALTYHREGLLSEAEAHYRRSLQLNPDEDLALNNLAILLKNTNGDLQEARTLLERAIDVVELEEDKELYLSNLEKLLNSDVHP